MSEIDKDEIHKHEDKSEDFSPPTEKRKGAAEGVIKRVKADASVTDEESLLSSLNDDA